MTPTPPSRPEQFVAGLVLAAGGSTRLGQPKQLLPFGAGTLLGSVLDTARACGFDQLTCVVRDGLAGVDVGDVTVVENPDSQVGCSTSIVAGLRVIDPRADTLVLMLGDQPGVSPAAVHALIAQRGGAPIAACRYDDGRGHPLAFGRETFGDLRGMHGDKSVWKLMDRRPVREVPVPGPIPRDIDTWEDYEAVSGRSAARPRPRP